MIQPNKSSIQSFEHFMQDIIASCSLQCFDSKEDFSYCDGIFLPKCTSCVSNGDWVQKVFEIYLHSPSAKDVLFIANHDTILIFDMSSNIHFFAADEPDGLPIILI